MWIREDRYTQTTFRNQLHPSKEQLQHILVVSSECIPNYQKPFPFPVETSEQH